MSTVFVSIYRWLFETEAERAQRKIGQRFVDDLMSRSVDENAQTMTVLENLLWVNGCATDLVIRTCTIPFWKACVELVDHDTGEWQNYRVCTVGSPGIGKTTSTSVLIYMLLKQEKTVLYHMRGKGWIYEFRCTVLSPATETEPQKHSCACKVYNENSFPQGIPSTNDKSVYYIVDPHMKRDSCNPSDSFKAKVIIVSSPNNLHWGGSAFGKRRSDIEPVRGGLLRYYPLWTLEELLDGRRSLNNSSGTNLDEKEVKRRYVQVGGVPRNVFRADHEYTQALSDQSTALADLTEAQVQRLAMRSNSPIVSHDSSDPKGALIGYKPREGETSFAVLDPCFVSFAVEKRVYEIHLNNVWEDIFNAADHGPAFEKFTWMLMVGHEKRSFDMRAPEGEKDMERPPNSMAVLLGGCSGWRIERNIVAAALMNPGVLFLPTDRQHEFIDFVYAEKNDDGQMHVHAFKATVAASHKAKKVGIKNFETALQVVQQDSDNNDQDDVQATVYFLVPSSRYQDFKTDPVVPTAVSPGIDFKVVEIPKPSCDLPNPAEVPPGAVQPPGPDDVLPPDPFLPPAAATVQSRKRKNHKRSSKKRTRGR